jgi:hypothetical protein
MHRCAHCHPGQRPSPPGVSGGWSPGCARGAGSGGTIGRPSSGLAPHAAPARDHGGRGRVLGGSGALVRAGVGAGDSCAPFDELKTAVVVRGLAFDQHRAALVRARCADGVGQFPAGCRSQAQPVAVLGVPGVDQAGVVPVLEVVVRAVVDRRARRARSRSGGTGSAWRCCHGRSWRLGTATSRSASRRGDRPPAPWSSLSSASSIRVGRSALLVPPLGLPAGRDRLRNRKLPAAAAASTARAAK